MTDDSMWGDKRAYRDRAYRMKNHSYVCVMLYLIDRMEPRPKKKNYGWVLPAFASTKRIANDMSMDWKTVKHVLDRMNEACIIHIEWHEEIISSSKKCPTGLRKVIDGIEVAPPDKWSDHDLDWRR